ncbi:MAG: c-type cytochrome [Nevskiales bacterium]
MSANHDKVFIVTFAGVLAFLMAFAGVIFIIANLIQSSAEGEEMPAELIARIEERTAPIGKVNTDPNAALAAAAEAAASGSAELSGAEVVKQVCAGCHAAGVLGAMKIGDKGAWSARGSVDQMLKVAIAGKGAMPARGGNPGLTDDQVREAIVEMSK